MSDLLLEERFEFVAKVGLGAASVKSGVDRSQPAVAPEEI
jgi:hypothetical protein